MAIFLRAGVTNPTYPTWVDVSVDVVESDAPLLIPHRTLSKMGAVSGFRKFSLTNHWDLAAKFHRRPLDIPGDGFSIPHEVAFLKSLSPAKHLKPLANSLNFRKSENFAPKPRVFNFCATGNFFTEIHFDGLLLNPSLISSRKFFIWWKISPAGREGPRAPLLNLPP